MGSTGRAIEDMGCGQGRHVNSEIPGMMVHSVSCLTDY